MGALAVLRMGSRAARMIVVRSARRLLQKSMFEVLVMDQTDDGTGKK